MTEPWSRAGLTAHVEALAHERKGEAFVAEIAKLSRSLEPGERALLEEVLLERARREDSVGRAVRARAEEPGWLRRTLAKAEERAAELTRRRG